MNKYQDALNFLDFYCEVRHVEEYILLHKLVEKETPMKPINQYPIDFGLGNYGECKRCNNGVNYQQNRCDNCGQKLDWTELFKRWKKYNEKK